MNNGLKYVVAVRDFAMMAYAPPIFVPSKGVAIRSFADECNREDQNNNLNMHPEDFELHCLAMWDEDSGVFTSPGVEVLCRGKDVKG